SKLAGRARRLRHQARSLSGEIRDHDVRAGAPNSDERFHHDAFAIDPPALGRRFDHRILAADLISSHGIAGLLLDSLDDVEIRARGLHHDHVGPFLDIHSYLAHRLLDVRRIHLVAAAVTLLWRRLRRLTKGAVAAAGKFRRVAQYRCVRETRSVERLAD